MDNGCLEKTVLTPLLRKFKIDLLAINAFLREAVWPIFIFISVWQKASPYCKLLLSLADKKCMDFDADHLSCVVWWKWCGQQHAHIKGLALVAAVRAHCIVVSALNFPELENEAHNCRDSIRQSSQ